MDCSSCLRTYHKPFCSVAFSVLFRCCSPFQTHNLPSTPGGTFEILLYPNPLDAIFFPPIRTIHLLNPCKCHHWCWLVLTNLYFRVCGDNMWPHFLLKFVHGILILLLICCKTIYVSFQKDWMIRLSPLSSHHSMYV